MRLNTLVAGIALACAISFSGAQAANLVQDGDFTVPGGGPSFTTYNNTTMGPWTVDGSVDLIGGYWQAPPSGGGSVDLNGNFRGSISQDILLTAGQTYNLSFYLSGNPDGLPVTKDLAVLLTMGADTVTLTPDPFHFTTGSNTRSSMNYLFEAIDPFTVDATGTWKLTFESLDNDTPYGPVIGGVSLTGVPEPSTWAMLLIGFGALGFAARFVRRSGLAFA
jgi:hypothetical protein